MSASELNIQHEELPPLLAEGLDLRWQTLLERCDVHFFFHAAICFGIEH